MSPEDTARDPALAAPPRRLIGCELCGRVHLLHLIPMGSRASCRRCGATLYANKRDAVERAIPLYLAGVVLWIVANSFPFLTFEVAGRAQPTRLVSGVLQLYHLGMWELGGLVLLFVIVFPLGKLLTNLAVLVPLRLGRPGRHLAGRFRVASLLHPWAMTEVFFLGVLVSYAKLGDLGSIVPGPSLVAFIGLILVMIGGDAALDPPAVWESIEPLPPLPAGSAPGEAGLIACHTCHALFPSPRAGGQGPMRCTRCGARLHRRKVDSLSRCAALVLAAFILYIPANVYPVMTIISFGRGAPSTILGGVQELILASMYPLAALVFFASILIPLLKLIGLTYLVLSVRLGSRWRPRDRTVLYRILDSIGRWSMLDIFVLAILAALVRLGSIATIEPGVGAISFAAVVVLTMFAAMSFDPRLLWDAAGANDERSS
jgi:paraquat-inducible protein A